jgi:hypothetical protein
MITKEGKIEKTKPGSTTIYYVVDSEDGSGFYIEKINNTDYDEENAQKPDSTIPSAPMEPDSAIPSALWNPTCHPVGAYGTRPAILSAPMEPDSTDADVLGDPEATPLCRC